MNNKQSISSIKHAELPKIALLIPSLEIGGSERQFMELVKGIDRRKWNVLILTMYSPKHSSLTTSNFGKINSICLKKRNPVAFIYHLCKILHREKVAILHAYLLTAQFYSLLAKMFLWRVKLVFSVRDSLNIFQNKDFKNVVSNLFVYGCSIFVEQYILNSHAGMRAKKAYIPHKKMRIIFNGIDTEKFHSDSTSRFLLRQCIGARADAFIVGIVANVSRYKDYPTLVQAAKIVVNQFGQDVHFVVIGENRNDLGNTVRALTKELSIEDYFHFMGPVLEVEKLMPGVDILCSSSVTEGFSNSICEAMSCGIPCVVTDVGDSGFIVGDTGIVVPPSEPEKLANAILTMLRLTLEERNSMGQAAQQRILNEFTIVKMVTEHEAVYESLLKKED